MKKKLQQMFFTEGGIPKLNSSFELDVSDDISYALPFLSVCF